MSQVGKLRFVGVKEAEHERQPTGLHHWLSKPGVTEAENLVLVRVYMPPGQGHGFHRHPELEEIIYVLSGTAEQWVGEERRLLGPGEIAHIPRDLVHATYNGGDEELQFLAILSPAHYEGPFAVDVYDEEPWRSLRPPLSSESSKPEARTG
ncbi:MAG TPA: cupin domain-containing protein [Longimicrobiaceae bacterium]